MFFLQAAQAKIPLRIGKKLLLKVPKFEIDDAIEWASELLSRETERRTEAMSETQKAEFLNLYPPVGPDLNSMRSYLRTNEGVRRVIKTCLPRASAFLIKSEKKDGSPDSLEKIAPLTDDQVEQYIKVNGVGRLAGLAWVLADVDDQSVIRAPKDMGELEDDEDSSQRIEPTDPLTDSGSTPSAGTPATGPKISA